MYAQSFMKLPERARLGFTIQIMSQHKKEYISPPIQTSESLKKGKVLVVKIKNKTI